MGLFLSLLLTSSSSCINSVTVGFSEGLCDCVVGGGLCDDWFAPSGDLYAPSCVSSLLLVVASVVL